MPARENEIELLSISEALHNHPVALPDIARILSGTVITIGKKQVCMLWDIRIDQEDYKIYGTPKEIVSLGEYK